MRESKLLNLAEAKEVNLSTFVDTSQDSVFFDALGSTRNKIKDLTLLVLGKRTYPRALMFSR